MKITKGLSVFISLALCFSLCSCGKIDKEIDSSKDNSSTAASKTTTPTTTTQTTTTSVTNEPEKIITPAYENSQFDLKITLPEEFSYSADADEAFKIYCGENSFMTKEDYAFAGIEYVFCAEGKDLKLVVTVFENKEKYADSSEAAVEMSEEIEQSQLSFTQDLNLINEGSKDFNGVTGSVFKQQYIYDPSDSSQTSNAVTFVPQFSGTPEKYVTLQAEYHGDDRTEEIYALFNEILSIC